MGSAKGGGCKFEGWGKHRSTNLGKHPHVVSPTLTLLPAAKKNNSWVAGRGRSGLGKAGGVPSGGGQFINGRLLGRGRGRRNPTVNPGALKSKNRLTGLSGINKSTHTGSILYWLLPLRLRSNALRRAESLMTWGATELKAQRVVRTWRQCF